MSSPENVVDTMSEAIERPNIIDRFNGDRRFLSNFQASTIFFKGKKYSTVEHAYQAMKSNDPVEQDKIKDAVSASQAKKMGKTVTLREDWEDIKAGVMLELVRLKFQNPFLRHKLQATGNTLLVEGNTWHDTFFGVCNCDKHRGEGQNVLGKILMQVREEILQEEKDESIQRDA